VAVGVFVAGTNVGVNVGVGVAVTGAGVGVNVGVLVVLADVAVGEVLGVMVAVGVLVGGRGVGVAVGGLGVLVAVAVGGIETVKFFELVAVPLLLVTLIFPLVALAGTIAVKLVFDFTVKLLAGMSLNSTWVIFVKLSPFTVTTVPAFPEDGEKEAMVGFVEAAALTDDRAKLLGLTATPALVVTRMNPSVTPAGAITMIWVSEITAKSVAGRSLKVTVVAPVKLWPIRVTVIPSWPTVGVNDSMVGVAIRPEIIIGK